MKVMSGESRSGRQGGANVNRLEVIVSRIGERRQINRDTLDLGRSLESSVEGFVEHRA
jgi:hypothetical protein